MAQRQGDDHRRPDCLHRAGPCAPPADVRDEVQLKPIPPGVVDRATDETELATQQSCGGQVKGHNDGVVGREEFDKVDGRRADIKTLIDSVGDC